MKKVLSTIIVLLVINQCVFSKNNYKDYTLEKIERYKSEAKCKVSFVPLEIGEVTPRGWLAVWAKRAANGITGHLDEYCDVFKYGWKGFGFKAQGAHPDGTGWPIEQCGYWLDGATKLGYILRDSALIRKTSERLNLVVNGVLNGSKTFIYWKPKSITEDYFNNWAHSLMGRALVSYYQGTHNPKILDALTKVYSQYHLLRSTEKYRSTLDLLMYSMRGSTNLDAMSETYLMSGNKSILDSIIKFSKDVNTIATEDELMSLNENRPMTDTTQIHGVSYYEGLKVPAIMSLWNSDRNGIDISSHILSWGEHGNLLPYGVCSSQEFLSGVGSIRNTETCNVPTSMWSFLWMLRLTGNSHWSDKVENVFFNAGPAPIARDWKTMCYFQSPNRFDTKIPDYPRISGPGGLKYTKTGATLCCVGNVNNVIPDYISNMWMATMDNGLAYTLYGPCCVSKRIKDTDVRIICDTHYPFSNNIKIAFHLSKSIKMPVYLRIPGWCKKSIIVLNGRKINLVSSDGFVKIERKWNNNDRIVLTLPMKVSVHQGNETPYPQVSYFKSTKEAHDTSVHNHFEYVTYGPLLLSLPIKDINPNEVALNTKYNYALNINPLNIAKDVKVVKRTMVKDWAWKIEDAPILLRVKAEEFDWRPMQFQPLPSKSISSNKETTIDLIPYGCTKFRVTMFPVTKETWKTRINRKQ